MAVIELNLLNSQNEFSQMGEHFQDEHNLQKISQVERAPLLLKHPQNTVLTRPS